MSDLISTTYFKVKRYISPNSSPGQSTAGYSPTTTPKFVKNIFSHTLQGRLTQNGIIILFLFNLSTAEISRLSSMYVYFK